ncbi:hypothetical protein [Dethiobacter alkaliphilus]|uniref:hypothetical protein n=1 Tax=Dethiobacter alkaliphilus TaxID=427926 RepID=UPI0022261353|nr:hypothetical protein [Dethiobacter alkaliphilus]MCW3488696.1 hypothetical protein [Dethiobacter alkaliphilus]
MTNKKCPVCEKGLSYPLSPFCTQCEWDLRNDITLIPSLHEIPKKVRYEYTQKLNAARRVWTEVSSSQERQQKMTEGQTKKDTCNKRLTRREVLGDFLFSCLFDPERKKYVISHSFLKLFVSEEILGEEEFNEEIIESVLDKEIQKDEIINILKHINISLKKEEIEKEERLIVLIQLTRILRYLNQNGEEIIKDEGMNDFLKDVIFELIDLGNKSNNLEILSNELLECVAYITKIDSESKTSLQRAQSNQNCSKWVNVGRKRLMEKRQDLAMFQNDR